MDLKEIWSSWKLKKRLLHAINNGVTPLNEEELVEARTLLREHCKIAKVSAQAVDEAIISDSANIIDEDEHEKTVEKRQSMHLHFNFMLQIRNKKISKGKCKGRIIEDLTYLTFYDLNTSFVVGEWMLYL